MLLGICLAEGINKSQRAVNSNQFDGQHSERNENHVSDFSKQKSLRPAGLIN